jgi:hypothetical protein
VHRLLLASLLVIAVTLPGCVAVPHHHGKPNRGHGPPPHAPAHGYRQKHQGADLVFDSRRHVYVVVGHADHFFVDDHFLRLHAGAWQASASLRGPWHAVASHSVPPGLRAGHPGKGKAKAKKGKPGRQPPAKGHW